MAVDVKKGWALVLGGSSGLGLATAKKLARNGFNILIVHRDRKSDLKEITSQFHEITSMGVKLRSFNVDAGNSEKRGVTIAEIKSLLGELGEGQRIKVLVHSIAKGNLKPMHSEEQDILNHQDFQVTLNAMALSLYDWTKDLVHERLFGDDARIISFTSEGSSKAWPGYAAVSAAKATLEALTRNIALEFAPLGIKANCIQAGATETRAFQMIPGHEQIKKDALQRNPNGRLTTPEDVANAVYLLTTDEARWITGTVIKVDGGESLR
ncbi:enoyl-ACP reductase [Pricia sp.]|uniref:enoyl-ACP reductase FabI n=1 Tax=Pricia sp. TaxID=2268138 RepID=UPI0035946193